MFFIAECGLNHDGSLNKALKMVEQSSLAGVNAFKLQTFKTDQLFNPYIFSEGAWIVHPLFKDFKSLEIDKEFHQNVFNACQKYNLEFISSPFSEDCLNIVAEFSNILKIASSEILNYELLSQAGQSGKKIILSTGMHTLKEIDFALNNLLKTGAKDITLMYCVSLYPPNPQEVCLSNLEILKTTFHFPLGFSDHCISDELALGAMVLGVKTFEKHITLVRENRPFDHNMSLEMDEVKELVNKMKRLEVALQPYDEYFVSVRELRNRAGALRSLYLKQDLEKGTALTRDHLKAVRPFFEIGVEEIDNIIGKKLNKTLKKHEPLKWEDLI